VIGIGLVQPIWCGPPSECFFILPIAPIIQAYLWTFCQTYIFPVIGPSSLCAATVTHNPSASAKAIPSRSSQRPLRNNFRPSTFLICPRTMTTCGVCSGFLNFTFRYAVNANRPAPQISHRLPLASGFWCHIFETSQHKKSNKRGTTHQSLQYKNSLYFP
jgi:hypothetical protein